MSIAHVRAKSMWLWSSTSSLKPCNAPSGNAIKRTGKSRLVNQQAALTRCDWCSMLRMMSARSRTPHIVGTRPTALYGSIIAVRYNAAETRSDGSIQRQSQNGGLTNHAPPAGAIRQTQWAGNDYWVTV